jgi:hypothetical protein
MAGFPRSATDPPATSAPSTTASAPSTSGTRRRSPAPARRDAKSSAATATHDGQQERPGLEEREVRAVEVDGTIGRGERAGQQDGQERADADRGGQAGALEEVEDEVHESVAWVPYPGGGMTVDETPRVLARGGEESRDG